jgi:hypothetical protein
MEMIRMDYILMHKDIIVAELTIDSATGSISKVSEISRPEHLPVGILVKNGAPDRKSLNDWWLGRAIPATRSGLRDALEAMRVSSPSLLLTKAFGLSLSDQYWVSPKDKPVEWRDVNFFANDFSEDVGNALFGRTTGGAKLDLMSPDNTSDGGYGKNGSLRRENACLLKVEARRIIRNLSMRR